ncbi:MAG: hypothetical protein HGB05_14675, partial [Chloroflexi bacterium]|nr:hypothetical protein [Chloroflexota bacterium]
MTFSYHHVAFLFFAVSIYLTTLALRDRRRFWLYLPFSIVLGGLQMFMIEYFALLEFTRLLLIWYMHLPGGRGAFRKALLT